MFWFCSNVVLIGKTHLRKEAGLGKGRELATGKCIFFSFFKAVGFLARNRIYYTEYCFFQRVDKRIKQIVKANNCNKQCIPSNF